MSKRFTFTTAAAAAVLSIACVATPTARAADDGKLSKAEATFLRCAAIDNMTEIKMSQIAVEQAQDPQVKQFAQQMVTDHTKASEQLKQVAQQKDVKVPTDLPKDRDEEIAALKSLQGKDFDQAYMSNMKAAHLKDVSKFSDKAQTAKDPDVKAFAAQLAPQLQQHQQHALSLAASQGLPTQHVAMSGSGAGGAAGADPSGAQPAAGTVGGSSAGQSGTSGSSGGSSSGAAGSSGGTSGSSSGASGSSSGGASGSGSSGSSSGGSSGSGSSGGTSGGGSSGSGGASGSGSSGSGGQSQ